MLDMLPLNIGAHEPGQQSPYGDWLRAGRQRGRISNPGRVKNYLYSMWSRPVLGPTQPIQLKLGALSQVAEVRKMWIYTMNIHSPIRLQRVGTPLSVNVFVAHVTIHVQGVERWIVCTRLNEYVFVTSHTATSGT
jgi:hypothetical protein